MIKHKKILLRVTEEIHDKLLDKAHKNKMAHTQKDISINEIILNAIKEYVKEEK